MRNSPIKLFALLVLTALVLSLATHSAWPQEAVPVELLKKPAPIDKDLLKIEPKFEVKNTFNVQLQVKPELPEGIATWTLLGLGAAAGFLLALVIVGVGKAIRWAVAASTTALLLTFTACADAEPVKGGPTSPDGKVTITIDLPAKLRMRNSGGSDGPRGPGSGSGLCVNTSIEHSARWQNEARLFGLQKKSEKFPGGSMPPRVARDLPKFGLPADQFLQYEGPDFGVMREALKAGLFPAGTYGGKDWFYGASQVTQHMVNYAYIGESDDDWCAVMDNNHPPDVFNWMKVREGRERWYGWDQFGRPRSQGWTVLLKAPPPPPLPTLMGPVQQQAAAGQCDCGPGCPGGCDCGCRDQTVFGQRRGGCPGGQCGPGMGGELFAPYLPVVPTVQPGVIPVDQTVPLTWHALDGYPAKYRWLYQGHRLVGRWNIESGEYHLRDFANGSELWFPALCPVAPPVEARAKTGQVGQQKDFGMKWQPNGHERYQIGDQEVSRGTFQAALQGIPGVAGLLRVTTWLPQEDRGKVTAALTGEWQSKVVVQSYEPGEPFGREMAGEHLGYPQKGILVQRSNGQVCAYLPEFTTADDLVEGLRRAANPGFDPKALINLDPRKPLPTPAPAPGGDPLGAIDLSSIVIVGLSGFTLVLLGVLFLGGIAVLFFLFRKGR